MVAHMLGRHLPTEIHLQSPDFLASKEYICLIKNPSPHPPPRDSNCNCWNDQVPPASLPAPCVACSNPSFILRRSNSISKSPGPSSPKEPLLLSRDISRSESLRCSSSYSQQIFRPCDLIHGEVLGKGFFGQAIKVSTGSSRCTLCYHHLPLGGTRGHLGGVALSYLYMSSGIQL